MAASTPRRWPGRSGASEVEEIDRLNILNATFLAMQRAVASVGLQPAEIHVDGNRVPEFSGFAGPVRAIVGGDRSSPAIAAASNPREGGA